MRTELVFLLVLLAIVLLEPLFLSDLVQTQLGKLASILAIIWSTIRFGVLSGVIALFIYIVLAQRFVEGNDPKAKVPTKKVPLKKAGRVETEEKMRKGDDPKIKEGIKPIMKKKKEKVANSVSPISEGFSLLNI
jgi:hypothetical protein